MGQHPTIIRTLEFCKKYAMWYLSNLERNQSIVMNSIRKRPFRKRKVLKSSMSIVPKLTYALKFFNLESKKCNWGGQTLSYSYPLLFPASILPHKHTLWCYNDVLMVVFEQFFMNLKLCTCKYNSTQKYETQVLVRLLYSIEEAMHLLTGKCDLLATRGDNPDRDP